MTPINTNVFKPDRLESWLPHFTAHQSLLNGVLSSFLNWQALETDLASQHFNGCLTLVSDQFQVRIHHLDGLKIGMVWACSTNAPFGDVRRHQGLVSLYELELPELLRLIRLDVVAMRTVSTSLHFGGEGLIEYIDPNQYRASAAPRSGNLASPSNTVTPPTPPTRSTVGITPAAATNTASSVTIAAPSAAATTKAPSLETIAQGWGELLRRSSRTVGKTSNESIEAFERCWRISCHQIANSHPIIDPFAAEIEWNGRTLSLVTNPFEEIIEALQATFLQTIQDLNGARPNIDGLNLQELARQHPGIGLEGLAKRLEMVR